MKFGKLTEFREFRLNMPWKTEVPNEEQSAACLVYWSRYTIRNLANRIRFEASVFIDFCYKQRNNSMVRAVCCIDLYFAVVSNRCNEY